MPTFSLYLRRVSALVAVLFLPLVAACGPLTGTVTEDDRITIGMVSYPGDAPYIVAEEEGLFRKHGVEAHVTIISDMTQAIAALSSGSMQFFFGTADFATVVANAGVDAKQIMITDVGDGADGMLASADIKSVSDLKGKTVYLALGTPSHFLFRTVTDEEGLKTEDVHLVKMEADQVGTAFAAGKIDAGMSWEPWLTKASAEREGGRVLFTSHDRPGIIADTLIVSGDFLRERPQDAQAVVAALFEAVEVMKANPAKAHAIAGKGLGLTAEEFAEQAKSVRFLSPEENVALFDKTTPRNLYELTDKAEAIFRADGIIERDIDADAIIDASVIRAYLSSQ